MAKRFQGSWCFLVFLLCFGIIPAIIYFIWMYKEDVNFKRKKRKKMIFMMKDERGLIENCAKCGAKISPGYDICLSCGYKFSSDTKVEKKARIMNRFNFTLSNSWLFILGGSFLVSISLVVAVRFIIFGVVFIIFGVVGIYFIKKKQMKPKGEVKSRELKDYFSSIAIISIISGLVGIIIYYIFDSGSISLSSPLTDLESLYAAPFLLVSIISGMLGVGKESIPVIELIGGLIGFIWFFMSIMPVLVYLINLFS
ncbi:hypothetical protein ES705_12616 [subsurface metagenome]